VENIKSYEGNKNVRYAQHWDCVRVGKKKEKRKSNKEERRGLGIGTINLKA